MLVVLTIAPEQQLFLPSVLHVLPFAQQLLFPSSACELRSWLLSYVFPLPAAALLLLLHRRLSFQLLLLAALPLQLLLLGQ